jgi:hypothetical protein
MPARRTKRRSRPLFPRTEQNHAMIHASEASALYASQTEGQTRRHRDNHDSTRRSCIVHRATYDRTRRYSIKGQEPLLQQWYTTDYRRPRIFFPRKNIMQHMHVTRRSPYVYKRGGQGPFLGRTEGKSIGRSTHQRRTHTPLTSWDLGAPPSLTRL